MQHLEGIARAVADRQHHMLAGNVFTIRQYHTMHLSIFDNDVFNPALETKLAAQRFDGVTHLFHHIHQPESADMGFTDVKNLLRRTCLHEFGENFSPMRISGL